MESRATCAAAAGSAPAGLVKSAVATGITEVLVPKDSPANPTSCFTNYLDSVCTTSEDPSHGESSEKIPAHT